MLQVLENRVLLAVSLVGRVLDIQGHTTVELFSADRQQSVIVRADGVRSEHPRSGFDSIRVVGDGSNNAFFVREPNQFKAADPDRLFRVPLVMKGGGGDDTLRGGHADDTVQGGGSRDRIKGNGGNDFITGGDGQDTISGGAGNDHLEGQGENDQLFGGSGRDRLYGGRDDDLFVGGSGDDILLFYGGGFDVNLLWDDASDDAEADAVVRGEIQGTVVVFFSIDGISGCAAQLPKTGDRICDVILGR